MHNDIETKATYSTKIEAKIEQLNAQINDMLEKTSQGSAEIEERYYQQIDDLCRQRDAIQEKLRDLKSSSSDAWYDLRYGIERAWAELSHAFEMASRRF